MDSLYIEAAVGFPKNCDGAKILSAMTYEWTYRLLNGTQTQSQTSTGGGFDGLWSDTDIDVSVSKKRAFTLHPSQLGLLPGNSYTFTINGTNGAQSSLDHSLCLMILAR